MYIQRWMAYVVHSLLSKIVRSGRQYDHVKTYSSIYSLCRLFSNNLDNIIYVVLILLMPLYKIIWKICHISYLFIY